MAITYKDINQLTQKSSVAGTEKLPVSDTQYITTGQLKDVFIATYGTTTYQDVETAYLAGKAVYCLIDENPDYYHYPLIYLDVSGVATFESVESTFIYRITLDDHDVWDMSSVGLQQQLVSGTNIKTINSTSLLGSGDISIPALPSVSMAGLFLESKYNSSTNQYYWAISDRIYHGSSGASLELAYNDNLCIHGSVGSMYLQTEGIYKTGFNDWSWLTLLNPSTGAIIKSLQDDLDSIALPAVTSADYGKMLYVAYDSTKGYYWSKEAPFHFESGLLCGDAYYGIRLSNTTPRNLWLTAGEGVSYDFSQYDSSPNWNWIWYTYYSGGTTHTAYLQDALNAKQATLVSGTNIKTINNQSILGSGNITIQGGGGSTADCVHITGDETVGGDKTFTDDIVVGDASNIKYGASSGQGFTMDNASTACINTGYVSFSSLSGEPKAFIMTFGDVNAATANNEYIIAVIGDSTGTHAVYTTGTQNNYSSGFTTSYSNGNFTITAPTGISFPGGGMTHHLVYYYGNGNLTFHTAQVSPGSGATSVTFTGTGLTAVPEMYATMLETQVNNESYRRVSLYTNCSARLGDVQALGVSFYSSNIYDTTSNFTVSYNNGLFINSGGTNAGGYFHNPGTYTLYYLMASDVGGGGGSYSDLADELSAMNTAISGKQATLVSGTNIKTINNTTLLGSGNISIPTLPTVTTTNNGQILEVSNGAWAAGRKITVSTSEPTAATGSNGDIWIVI